MHALQTYWHACSYTALKMEPTAHTLEKCSLTSIDEVLHRNRDIRCRRSRVIRFFVGDFQRGGSRAVAHGTSIDSLRYEFQGSLFRAISCDRYEQSILQENEKGTCETREAGGSVSPFAMLIS